MAGQLSQKEYLKRYLSGSSKDEKKKKKKKKRAQRLTIVDDNLDPQHNQDAAEELDLYDIAENAPQVVAVVDDRPVELQAMETFKNTSKWKSVESKGYLEHKSASPTWGASGRGNDSDISPPRQIKEEPDSDLSPPRPRANKLDKYGSDDDLSPPRSGRDRDRNSDIFPPRSRAKKPSSRHRDEDLSPPRSERVRDHDFDISPPRSKTKKPGSRHRNENISPPRSKGTRDEDSDISPPRAGQSQRGDSDISSPRGGSRHSGQSSRQSRWERKGNEDLSAPGKLHKHGKSHSQSESSHRDRENDVSPPRRTIKQEPGTEKLTLDGKTAGLQDAATLKRETERLKAKENEHFAQMSDLVSGRGAKAILRDRKTGKKRDLIQEQKEQQAKEEEEERKLAEFQKIGKGLVQVEEQSRRLQDYQHEASKPMARYVDDQDLENMLRAQEREGDPMLEYLREKNKQDDPALSKPRFQGPFPPNRYNIRPGHKWDGVDRSTGFEKKIFDARNAKKALEEEAYKWSVADM